VHLTATIFLTLDGVAQSPGAPDEDRGGGFERGGWLVPYADNDMGEVVAGWFAQADAFLLGGRTYDIFTGHWPHVPDDNPVAAALNKLPKYVVSTTRDTVTWHNSTLIKSNLVDAVRELKTQPGNELQIHGSVQLTRSLMAHNLIDEYRLLIYPVVLGTGQRLFDTPELATALRLVDSRTTSAGVIVASYHPDGPPRHGSFASAPEPDQHRILR
jgi:dihydrofolate reductase